MVYQLPIPAYQIAAEVDEIKSEHLLSLQFLWTWHLGATLLGNINLGSLMRFLLRPWLGLQSFEGLTSRIYSFRVTHSHGWEVGTGSLWRLQFLSTMASLQAAKVSSTTWQLAFPREKEQTRQKLSF